MLLTKVVALLDPFQRTTEFETKLLPFTFSGNPSPPTIAEDGLTFEIEGIGLAMMIEKAFVVVSDLLSVTRIVKLKRPPAVGVPLIVPELLSDRPGGSDSETTNHS